MSCNDVAVSLGILFMTITFLAGLVAGVLIGKGVSHE